MAQVAEATKPAAGVQEFADLMVEVAALEPQQQEKLTFYVQGYVAAAAGANSREKSAIK